MKNGKMIIAAVAVLVAAAVSARADEGKIDFDGAKRTAVFNVEAVKADLADAKLPEPLAAAVPVQADKNAEIVIKAKVKNGSKITEETLTCKPGQGADKVSDCRKSDSAALTIEEVNTLSLRSYYSEETLKFADLLSQNKHSYTNQSGPQTFSCQDECAEYTSVPFVYGFGFGVTVPVSCVRWSHSCTCTAGCYE
jgi:hypothetical protein